MGTLYLVSTPIGNLGDITLRALDTLRSAGLIVAEDTRHTRKLLAHYDIHRPTLSYNEHSPPGRLEEIIRAASEGDVALVTDAGTPSLSDPGRQVVIAAVEEGIAVTAAPGPSAALTALVLSGLPTDGALFLGFLPRRASARRSELQRVRSLPYTVVLYESPHRLLQTLRALEAELGNRQVTVARELTKLHEEVRRSTLREEIEYWQQVAPRGEYTLVIEGASKEQQAAQEPARAPLAEVARLVEEGMPPNSAVKQVAQETGANRRQLYREWLERML